MPALERREAVERLIEIVQAMGPDDLLDFRNEVFPQHPASDLDSAGGPDAVRRKVTDYLSRGVEIEEILDFWNVALPEAYDVHFDEETDELHYSELVEAGHQAD